MVYAKSDLRSIRAQTAVVRTLVAEMGRDHGHNDDDARLRAQAIEESARLVSQIQDLARRGSDRSPSGMLAPPSHWTGLDRSIPRVLLVEDDDITRNALARWLAQEYEVVVARDGGEGVHRAASQAPDVIVADVWMPRMDGIEMARRIRETSGCAPAPVIFLTGQSAPETVAAGISAGGVGYLIKPVDLDLLDDELRTALASRHAGLTR